MKQKFGATGRFPRGKALDDDEGELRIGYVIQGDTLLMFFGKPITWFGLDADALEGFITRLQDKLAEMRGATP